MFPLVFLAFIGMPIIEIWVLIEVGSEIGALATIGLVILSAVVGTALLRAQGLSTWAKLQRKLERGELPAVEMLEGVALLIGGALLLTPGFVTDAIGLLCLLAPARMALVRWMLSRAELRVSARGHYRGPPGGSPNGGFSGNPGGGPGASRSSDADRQRPRVIEGEYERDD